MEILPVNATVDTTPKSLLAQSIAQKTAVVGIVGIGYVGSALAYGISQQRYKTIGLDINKKKVAGVNKEKNEYFRATQDSRKLAQCDIILICVPTPILDDKTPDLSFFTSAIQSVAENLRVGQLVIVESSVAVGSTRNVALPILLSSKLRADEEFFLAFSPERVDPANSVYEIATIPKVVSGFSETSRELAAQFYRSFIQTVVPVSSLETAEMTKLFENTFRLVNISLVNELGKYADAVDIDMWEIIAAASTKPFGFLPHFPGPGIGGHCIPVDPYYLLDDAQKRGISLSLIQSAGEINDQQPRGVVEKALALLTQNNSETATRRVFLTGITYKPNVADVRESPLLKIWEMFERLGHQVSYHDPFVPIQNGVASSELSDDNLSMQDIIIIGTNHANIDYEKIVAAGKPILDTRNALRAYDLPHIHRL